MSSIAGTSLVVIALTCVIAVVALIPELTEFRRTAARAEMMIDAVHGELPSLLTDLRVFVAKLDRTADALAGAVQAVVSGLVWEKSGVSATDRAGGAGSEGSRTALGRFAGRPAVEGPARVALPGGWGDRGGGGGSYPPGWNGWHLHRRLTESKDPRRAPWPSRHARAYREQDGSNRHTGPKAARIRRERVSW